ncbi:hypothetical protein L3C95_15850 [Chitinophaga filiformis]|uniref:hypothetical protein n=1 Tax=Chitinophaga filiformis TaxID=104663 RepID=UPI001F1D8A97|nr:hypothetical protein [Chitinophaga filiformis]MCF6404371.1 hypothetical protein [Chitinophaga filiformis]
MENVISNKQALGARKSFKERSNAEDPMDDLAFEEALKDPFTRKKYERAKATLERCPFPMELLREK